jgi:hypothetical protein
MSDNVTAAATAALNNGCDIESGGYGKPVPCPSCAPGMGGYAYGHLTDALRAKAVTMARLRQAATRALRIRFELGLFDPPETSPFAHYGAADLFSPAHQMLARRSALQSLVLLRNVNGTALPFVVKGDGGDGYGAGALPPTSGPPPRLVRRLAVVGPNADSASAVESNYNGCVPKSTAFVNSADPSPNCTIVTPLQGIRAALAAIAPGPTAGSSTVQLAFAQGVPLQKTDPKADRASIAAAAAAAAAADGCVLVLGLQSAGRKGNTGNSDDLEDEGHPTGGDRVRLTLPGNQLVLAKAVIAAQPHTVLVLESAGMIAEPELMDVAAGRSLPAALIQMFYPGGEGGHALAAVLFGLNGTTFSGKMPVTAVRGVEQLPPYLTQRLSAAPGRTHRYSEVVPLFPFGYGLSSHPLSYTGLAVAPASVAAASTANITIRVALACQLSSRGSGRVAAPTAKGWPQQQQQQDVVQQEVVQVYIGLTAGADGVPVDARFRELGNRSIPHHELRAFRRVAVTCGSGSGGGSGGGVLGEGTVQAASRQTVELTVPVQALQLMESDGAMAVIAGRYTVWVGGTSPRTPAALFRSDRAPTAPSRPLTATFVVH